MRIGVNMWLNGACFAFDNAPTLIRHSSSSSIIECSKPVFRAISFYATFVSDKRFPYKKSRLLVRTDF